ncbi:MAG TPA: hypothetical protein PLE61_03140 [Vicinamibacterales bacterium]|nr:hypothetical protein [Vicinamibacterales bacterium]HPW19785.1 hypothetical protein [Vicinamibacterales bacterium]
MAQPSNGTLPAGPPGPRGQGRTWARWTAVLDEPLVRSAIERAPDTWRSAGAISAETGIPLDRVTAVLTGSLSDIIVAPGGHDGACDLYSTRTHYRKTKSLLERYLDVLDSP